MVRGAGYTRPTSYCNHRASLFGTSIWVLDQLCTGREIRICILRQLLGPCFSRSHYHHHCGRADFNDPSRSGRSVFLSCQRARILSFYQLDLLRQRATSILGALQCIVILNGAQHLQHPDRCHRWRCSSFRSREAAKTPPPLRIIANHHGDHDQQRQSGLQVRPCMSNVSEH